LGHIQDDPEIDIVIEVVGGIDMADKITMAGLKN